MKDDILIGDTPKAKRRRRKLKQASAAGRLWKHSTLADIHGLVPRSQIEDAFTVTLVRNPWDRIASLYHWLRHQSFDHVSVHLAKKENFSGFVQSAYLRTALRANPYAHYMTRADGVEDCDLYIRLEHFEEDAARFWAHLGFEMKLPRTNPSQRPTDWRALYTTADIERVHDLCEQDIARFGYRFF